jgi:hypothetical protein
MKALSWEGIDAQQGVAHERAATSLFEICVTRARRVNLVVMPPHLIFKAGIIRAIKVAI